MKIEPTLVHLHELIKEVDKLLGMMGVSDGSISLHVYRCLHHWSKIYDVSALNRYFQCMLESFSLAAARGISGVPWEVERSMLSLRANVCYYQGRVDAAAKAGELSNAAACAA